MKKIIPPLALLALAVTNALAQKTPVHLERKFALPVQREIYVDLNIDAGEIRILRQESAREIRFSLFYREDEYRAQVDYDAKRRRVRLDFEKEALIDRERLDGDAEIEIFLPVEPLLLLESRIRAGKIEMRLGDLSFRRLFLRLWAGEVELDFDAPNRLEMDALTLNVKMGVTRVRRLGNARFRYAEINSGIGSLDLDFVGMCAPEARAEIDLDIGHTVVRLPQEVGVRLAVRKILFLSQINLPREFEKDGDTYLSPNFEQAKKSMLLEIRPGIGELQVEAR